MATTLDFRKVLGEAQHSAVHLEMRDNYLRDGLDDPAFIAWRDRGLTLPDDEDMVAWRELVKEMVACGVAMRRARVVSEPITQYVRFEYEISKPHNIGSGEQLRWLPRRRASDIALPGNDFWLIDGKTVVFNHFGGYGGWAGSQDMELRTELEVAEMCSRAFEAVWERGIPHTDYNPA